MKTIVLIASLILVATFVVACKRASKSSSAKTSGGVAFPDAGVAIDVGDGWQRVDINPGLPVCPPTLLSEHGMVRAILFAQDVSDLQKAATSLRAMADGNAEAVKDSFRQEDFVADSGLRGIHVSYAARSEQDKGQPIEIHSHNYIVTNGVGRSVSISYLAPAADDSNLVRQMIRKSLRLQ